jgi:hypothetical protein
MHLKRNIVTRSGNHFAVQANTVIHLVSVVFDFHVTVNYTNILSVAQQSPFCNLVRSNTGNNANFTCHILKEYNTMEPRFTNLIRSWRPFVTRNVRKPKLCVLRESYTATAVLPPILPACRHPLLPAACSLLETPFVNRDFFFGKFVCELICSWWEAFVMRGVRDERRSWWVAFVMRGVRD